MSARLSRTAVSLAAGLLLAGCGMLDRLSTVGRPPEMTKTADPTKDPSWRPITMPMPKPETPPNEANALWRQGSRAFFKDQRAAQVGDVVTIVVSMNDTANVQNGTTATRTGTGQIQRSEAVTLRLAGVITQVLPNGNLVVAARQEFRVNSELRELLVTGVIRPQDIASDNTVTHDRMAEARISYGGKGQLTDVQSARWGQQIMDIMLPF
jgi:flagellar L-ring protein precursor FlgH